MPKKPRMTAGSGSGKGRMQKTGMAKNRMRTGASKPTKSYMCGGKVKTKRGYGAARKG